MFIPFHQTIQLPLTIPPEEDHLVIEISVDVLIQWFSHVMSCILNKIWITSKKLRFIS